MLRTRRVLIPSTHPVKVSFNHAGNSLSPSVFCASNLGNVTNGQGNYLILLGADEIPDTSDPNWATNQELGWVQPVGSPREIALVDGEEVWAICAPATADQPATEIHAAILQTKVV